MKSKKKTPLTESCGQTPPKVVHRKVESQLFEYIDRLENSQV